jgi:apolipoprotein N-acyltransferase
MDQLAAFWEYFAGGGPVDEWRGLKNDGGHTATAGLVGCVLLLCGIAPFKAILIATVGCAAVQELADGIRFRAKGEIITFSWDMVSDCVSYQFLWVGFVATTGWWPVAPLLFAVLSLLYIQAVIKKLRL